jgi:hypothetical protein
MRDAIDAARKCGGNGCGERVAVVAPAWISVRATTWC